ncbi:MAG: hypothetical protein HLUCCA01_05980 [Bacteroidetes bacterium HLUCCA01]|nr:MAG: hypothetical protein HLUCCA01_05980 [Bacteroidetes bacterium HLUCCA01]
MKKNMFISTALILGVLVFSATGAVAQIVEQQPEAQGETVIDVINSSENHTVMASLLQETELDATLRQGPSFTVLAPTDEAFAELGDAVTELQANPEQLQQVLLNHLFQGAASAEEVQEALDVNVETGDLPASNGVVHSIDSVILER